MPEKPSHIRVGDRVWLTPVEPWDFVTETGSGPFEGVVNAVDERDYQAIVFRLGQPLVCGQISAELFLAYTRHVGSQFISDGARETTFCYVDSINEEQATRVVMDPQLRKRGELSMLGDLEWTTT